VPPRRWWELMSPGHEEDLEEALMILRTWVEKVYRPMYEREAIDLGDCWERHPLALFLLDWFSELHKVLYLRDERNSGHLTAMGDWHTRFLPIVHQMLRAATHDCEHQSAAALSADPPNGRVNGAVR
jgi:hypothetical protein